MLATFRRQMADHARGEELRKLREARHLSQEDAAHEIGVSVKALRAWEKGGGIRWPNAKRAGTFYEVEPSSLVTREPAGDEHAEIDEMNGDQLDRIEKQLREIHDVLIRLSPPETEEEETAETPGAGAALDELAPPASAEEQPDEADGRSRNGRQERPPH